MKFMKVGSRPDTFFTTEAVRSVTTDVSSDLIIHVKGSRYLLHKFPLLSKCLKLQKLCSDWPESSPQIVHLSDFPGGFEAFELCAKFCYGITVTLSAYNVVSARCAAEYLQMTEDAEKGNLISKLDVFFNTCVLHGWRDSVVTLQSTKFFPTWSEEVGITGKCIEAIASKTVTHPLKNNGANSHWWAEDIAELSIDLYWRTMVAIKSSGKIPSNLIGEALKTYVSKWLPNLSKNGHVSESNSEKGKEIISKNRLLLESIISLLPADKGAVSCSFLLKLLKAANFVNASSSSKMELAKKAGLQLEEATLGDLLIPSASSSIDKSKYDIDVVITMMEYFMSQGKSPPTSPPRSKLRVRRRRSRSAENADFELQESRRSSSASHSSKLKVAKLVDRYLQEIAGDVNLLLSKFTALAGSVPEFTRLHHDDLYKAIDTYLKAHPELNKIERKRLCKILDCKRLSIEASMHAAQNELLPLRVVVQVLFLEQARSTMAGGKLTELPGSIKALLANDNRDPSSTAAAAAPVEDQWNVSCLKSPNLKSPSLGKKVAANDDDLDDVEMNRPNSIVKPKVKVLCYLPASPRRMFRKLWPSNRNASDKNRIII